MGEDMKRDPRYGYFDAGLFYVGFAAERGEFIRIGFYKNLSELRRELEGRFNAIYDQEVFRDFIKDLKAYFSGCKLAFDYPFQIDGSSFQLKVWMKVREIGYGCVKSYRDIAAEIGKPKAFRAVASALKSNPLVLVIPCHRVVRSDGRVAGSGFSRMVREYLLKLEGALG